VRRITLLALSLSLFSFLVSEALAGPARQPEPAKKEPRLLTPEEAIQQLPQGKVTVEFKVKSALMHENPAFVPQGGELHYIEFSYHETFSFRLYGKAVTHIKRLGIEPSVHFRDKVVRVTGRVFANGSPNDKNLTYGLLVEGLDQFEVLK
jgi:hypothetical protein